MTVFEYLGRQPSADGLVRAASFCDGASAPCINVSRKGRFLDILFKLFEILM